VVEAIHQLLGLRILEVVVEAVVQVEQAPQRVLVVRGLLSFLIPPQVEKPGISTP